MCGGGGVCYIGFESQFLESPASQFPWNPSQACEFWEGELAIAFGVPKWGHASYPLSRPLVVVWLLILAHSLA